MNTIFKYNLVTKSEQVLQLPKGAKILTAQLQGDIICLWVIVDDHEAAVELETIYIVGTGHELPPGKITYISSIIQGFFVWHLFIKG